MGRHKIDIEDSLLMKNPELAAEWDYDRNGQLEPSVVPVHSGTRVYWKCSKCGQSWLTAVSHRTRGTGCPYCAGKKVISGITDLKTLYPELVKEWDYEQNGDLKPENMSVNSNKKVFWICQSCKGSWKTTIEHRVSGTGCPYCYGSKVMQGVNDFATLYPEIAVQWDYEYNGKLIPTGFKVNSGKVVYWKCDICKQTWKSKICHRTKGSGCPYCAGQRAIIGKTDLQTLLPEVAGEWDYDKNGKLLPYQVTVHSGQKVFWKCRTCNQSWRQTIDVRANGVGCPYCSGRKSIVGVNDLETVRPDIAKQWDYGLNKDLIPSDVLPGSGQKVFWKCAKCNQSWRATVLSRTSGYGCPNCSGHKRSVRRNV